MRAWRQGSMAVALCLNVSLACAADDKPGTDPVVNNPVELQSLQQLSATTGRPLFSPSRRPPPKPVAPVVVSAPPLPPSPPPSVVLLGIVSENGDGRAAIRASDKVVRVRAGDDVDGWKVERVEPRRLVLTQGERSVDFALFGGATKAAEAKPAKSAAVKSLERRLRQIRTVPPSD
ncbi:hypothetical protein [Bradyrhizobium prioriisuperbiae]|uniref:hypothetical protein n=1 Tax=Bradyrhizobium prioriisuperbiae TaxID=2854389 RepID=UPI0028E94FEC|nr:hypothetical protein [Bradyrhizobium prioritasuperba]